MSNKTKVAQLSDMASETRAPFIALTETHLNSEIQSAEIQIQGYKLYRSDRMGGRSHGGCAVYCREDLTVKEKMKFSNNYCESLILEVKELNVNIINIYRPPNTPQQLFEETLNKCQETLEEETNQIKSILALGDYNFPFIKWPSRTIYSRDNDPIEMSSEKKQGKMLLDWAEMNFLEQYIHTPTRKDNILDLVFTDSPNLIRGYETVVSKRFTDHNILNIYLTPSSEKEKEVIRKNPYPN